MTIAHIELVRYNVFSPLNLLHRLRVAAAALARARQRRRAHAQLYAMSEHELKDLGIGRSEVMHWATRP